MYSLLTRESLPLGEDQGSSDTSVCPSGYASSYFLEVWRGEWEVRDVQNIADILVDPEGSLERRNHWENTSHALLVGAVLHVLYAGPDKTLAASRHSCPIRSARSWRP